jgi:putative transposase
MHGGRARLQSCHKPPLRGALAPEVSMSKPPRDRRSATSNTYFVTLSAYQRQSLFQSVRVADLFLSTVFSYRDQNKFLVHEFVVMPNHAHLLITLQPDVTLERTIQFIKGGFSFRAGKELGMKKEIWQRGYVDHRIRDAVDYLHHRNYVWLNPVKAQVSETVEAFAFSSASGAFQLDPAPQGLKPPTHARAHGTTEVVPSQPAF